MGLNAADAVALPDVDGPQRAQRGEICRWKESNLGVWPGGRGYKTAWPCRWRPMGKELRGVASHGRGLVGGAKVQGLYRCDLMGVAI